VEKDLRDGGENLEGREESVYCDRRWRRTVRSPLPNVQSNGKLSVYTRK